MRPFRSLVLLGALALACRSPETTVTPTTTTPLVPASVTPPVVAKKGPTKLDRFFSPLVETLPKAATLSEQNGASNTCDKHGHVTYTLLYATSQKVPLASDADLVDLVPWLRHGDSCLRQIAIDAMVQKIGFDRNRLSLPGMHETDHWLYHQLFVALVKHLDEKRAAYPPTLFEGMYLDPKAADFEPLLAGKWEEAASPHKNFRTFVKLEGKQLSVTRHKVEADPKWPDHTLTSQVDRATVTPDKQFSVTGLWRQESNAKGYVGTKVQPSDTTYLFWPVARDVIWFDEGSGNRWIKLVRAR